MKSLKYLAYTLTTFLAIVGGYPAVAEEPNPDWMIGITIVQTAAEKHLTATKQVLAERSDGNVNPESLTKLAIAHKALAGALTASGDAINKTNDELIDASVACMKSPSAMSDDCQKKLDTTIEFAEWAIDALAAQEKLALSLRISEALLRDNEKSL